jgi:uncharacterized protein YbjT (DUF2867 family)
MDLYSPQGLCPMLYSGRGPSTLIGVVRPAAGVGKIPLIHPQDIAYVATEALVSETNRGNSLPIAGQGAPSYAEVATKIGTIIGKPIRFQPISEEDARQQQVGCNAPTKPVEARISIFRAIREGRLATVADIVERVIGATAH